MIYGIGIDSTEISRYFDLIALEHKLKRIFSQEEVVYCLSYPHHFQQAQSLAVRFAAREATWKALSSYEPKHTLPFFTFCKSITITHQTNGAPIMHINWETIKKYLPLKTIPKIKIHISLTHTKTVATAFIILSD